MNNPDRAAASKKRPDINNPDDMAELFESIRPMAEEGHAYAQNALGTLYYNGVGTDQNFEAAHKWYKLAAEQGEVRAQACLAGMYEAGIGVLQNLAEALKWYQSASEGGDAEAQANLGAIYANGSGVAKDYSSRSNAVVEKRSGAAAGESRKSPKG